MLQVMFIDNKICKNQCHDMVWVKPIGGEGKNQKKNKNNNTRG